MHGHETKYSLLYSAIKRFTYVREKCSSISDKLVYSHTLCIRCPLRHQGNTNARMKEIPVGEKRMMRARVPCAGEKLIVIEIYFNIIQYKLILIYLIIQSFCTINNM